jgi:hypothetical protein
MEAETLGRVTTEATFENLKDLWDVERGLLDQSSARRVVIPDALVDTGATLLSLPTKLIGELGLSRVGSKRVTSSVGLSEAGMFEAVRLTIGGRSCTMDVMEVPDGGYRPSSDRSRWSTWISSSTCGAGALIGNPAHGGEHMYELY